jgi:Ca2+-binding RTX toxin-like protein
VFETLESRRLLSVSAVFAAGVLTVTSDHAPDQVLIGTDNHGRIFVHANHHVLLAVPAHDVIGIAVDLGGGNDSLNTAHTVNRPMTIHGGAGNDTIVAGTGHDQIFGDEGDDHIASNDGIADQVDGGPGHDTALVDHRDHVTNVENVHGGHHHHHHRLLEVMRDDLLTTVVQ